jgi:phosphoribosyl 1,2-cyclic phosphodiesterase
MSSSSRPRVVFLGSGSSGNATVITDGTTSILIDCGFSAREVSRRLTGAGIAPSSLSAILITHEHGDHTAGVDVFCRRHAPDCALLGTAGTLRSSRFGATASRAQTLRAGETIRIGSLDVLAFRTSHDAAEPVGYRIETSGAVIGLASDTGKLSGEALEALAGCDILGIESNHDAEMLERGPYPAYLKRRIRSTVGHLSNTDAAEALSALASDRLRQVFGLHRSTTNNTAMLAETALRQRARQIGLDVPVTVTAQDRPVDSEPPQQTLFEATGS